MKSLIAIIAIAFTFGAIAVTSSATSALAKPMPQASVDEAARSPYVVLASYQGHESVKGRSNEDIYLSGFTATYKLESVLKQPSLTSTKDADPTFKPGKNFNVRYIVHDLTPCMADQSFRFSESVMPSKGSKWILFLSTKHNDHGWLTYRGSEGHLEASESNLKKVKSLLSAN